MTKFKYDEYEKEIILENLEYNKAKLCTLDLFIGNVSYESRSCYIINQIHKDLGSEKMMVFCTDNYIKMPIAVNLVKYVENLGCNVNKVAYEDYETVIKTICQAVELLTKKVDSITVGIDYSSMPRSWYCHLPKEICKVMRPEDKLVFLYTEGNYVEKPTDYPTAGLDMFELFSGKASLMAEHRAHIFALGYDSVRTQGIISKIEPEYVIVCTAYDTMRKDIYDNVCMANQSIINQAALAVTLDISDFSFMVTKLRELANELIVSSDVIFIPDGPKPLILAMSLIPQLCDRVGITCLHANRNYSNFIPIEVESSEKVVGFLMRVGNVMKTSNYS